ncbi:uncharacterized protein RHOBADRAFT_44061 [Rhodotorula graminis WP1]|uniref:C3H1-type domain-containing protein n=1 Tax=Rhodotorula graminis (strain WP1) TaxID=578459 RepID=A0A194S495_RHOGW|nr:uncharacterized protein RHOBADRAFT_44061 [Rhodotorula graminis WP1]KPV75553.1 hypothetical protein RHOBADRAFT_44061 [Rhodotorula graminis WP1]
MADDAAVLAEIARLSSAIEQRKASASTPPYRGSYRGRGGRGRGRTAPTAVHRNATWVAPGLSGASTPATTTSAAPTEPTSRTTTPVPPGGFRNQVLVLNKRADDSANLSSAPSSAPTSRRPSPAPPALDTTPKPPPPPREVVIGGVVFVADQRGNKLVRKPDADPSAVAPSSPSSPSVTTPKRTSHLGTTYIRTKAGNLVSLAFARRRKEVADARKTREDEMREKGERLDGLVGVVRGVQAARNGSRGRGRGRGRGGFTSSRPAKPKSDKLCRFFQRTGQCSRAHTCPYIHDSSKIAICPLFLRSSCPRPASSCPLSHQPNPHRSPHCAHFPACTRGAACPYAHVRVGTDAAPCRDFVELGWCALGDGCAKRHVRECWRFAETGRCDVKGCREPHVLRRVHGAEEDDDEDDDEEGGEVEGEGAGEELAIEWEEDEGDDDAAAARARGKRRAARDAEREGISGAAGRRLKKRLRVEQHERADGGFDVQEDFVELSVPISDDEVDDDEGDEGMSVDSDDLDEEEEQEEVGPPDALPAAAPPPFKSPSAPTAADIELDFGDDGDDDDDDSDDADIEQLLRR